MQNNLVNRRVFVGGTIGFVTLIGSGARAAGLPMPTSPVTLSIVDVAGSLALVQKSIEVYAKAHPNLVSRVNFSKAPAPELPGKLKAQQDANRVDIDMVLSGLDAISAGVEQKLWQQLFPQFSANLPDPAAIMHKSALDNQSMAKGYGLCMVASPGGPLLEYAPERVKTPPTTAEELLDWVKANPNRFLYARPANSGPGRAFLMGLPYILGDSNPKDPDKGWDKTWAFLKELGNSIEYYPTGTGVTMKEFGEGSRDMIVCTTGWDINPRAIGVVPKSAMVQTLKGFHFIADVQYMAIPNGVSAEKMAVIFDLMTYMMSPEAQATTYDSGYLYPGPAVKNVPLSMAPAESQAVIKEFGRDFYDKLIAETPIETPLETDKMVMAFKRWDQEIGAAKTK